MWVTIATTISACMHHSNYPFRRYIAMVATQCHHGNPPPLCAECGGCPPLLGATSKLCRSHHGVLSVSRTEATARCPARDHGLCQGLLWASVTVCGVSRPASQRTHRHHQQASHHLQDCSKERQGVGVQTHTYCLFSATATPAQPLPTPPSPGTALLLK